MPKFIPYTSLLNDVYIPFYKSPTKQTLTLKDLTIERDSDGIFSIINLNNYRPFIDTFKYDQDRKDWFYYSVDGLPYRLTYKVIQSIPRWTVESVYGVKTMNAYTDNLTIPYNFDKNTTNEFGLYFSVYDRTSGQNVKMFKGIPLMLAINNIHAKDITDYNNINIKPVLNHINTTINSEFYYDFDQNRIFTNQNLSNYMPDDIILGLYVSYDSINIKCRLATNEMRPSEITPIVDYYIAKLSGQNLRG